LPFQGLQLLGRRPPVDRGVIQLQGDPGLLQAGGPIAPGQLGQQVEPAALGIDLGHGEYDASVMPT